ncbi:lipoprotein LprG [Micromonospora pattaloongensis]|uniref:Lipoprotein LprG n=1 Tax=Micromonospora pattaloongensis TaxID=405436 RepID=A0A1H3S695_9ACTN|nr:LppX_LprAFG lipoprotein [Micromonospora pattaloongensis]SDZ33482.1 lipoprotein LprG [Micromonospora pattaloongensis]
MRRLAALAAVLVTLTALAGCTRGDRGDDRAATGDLPPAAELLSGCATELRSVGTARFEITTSGAGEMLGIAGAKGVITRAGDAEGTAQLAQGGNPVELNFVVKGDQLYVKGLTGGWQKLPLAAAASVYDPSALLDPDRGVAHVVATARDGRTEARESVDGVDTYRIRATFDTKALTTLVPGLNEQITGTLWVGADRRLLHRIELPVRNRTGTITVNLTGYDEPVTINAPV